LTVDQHKNLSRKNQELKTEVDRLRLENQTLRLELQHTANLRQMLRRTLGLGWREFREYVRPVRRNGGETVGSLRDAESFSPNFEPYQVRTDLRRLESHRPRVLHAIANFWTGGSARLVVDLIEYLGYRYEQEVIVRDLPAKPAYTGLRLHHYEHLKSPQQILSLLRTYGPDLLHVHYVAHHRNRYSELDWQWYSNVFQAAEAYGCRVVENINIGVDPYVSKAVDAYVYVSAFVEQEFGRADSRNAVVYPGSDLRFFSRMRGDPPEDCIGMVYRLEKDKLDEHSIDTLIEVVRRRRETSALVVGGGRYYSAYRKAVDEAGLTDAFTFTGYVSYENLPALYEKMSVFVAPVHTESFGQVSVFAMGMGIPVVGYDAGALCEIVEPRQLLAAPGDSKALAGIIVNLLDNRAERLRIGEANRRRAEQLFSVEAMIARYGEIYDRAIAKHAA
jgi:glycosyltransferase involved in cell wall biosynthesis